MRSRLKALHGNRTWQTRRRVASEPVFTASIRVHSRFSFSRPFQSRLLWLINSRGLRPTG